MDEHTSLSRKNEIARLIWEVKSFHGLVLSAKIQDVRYPDAAINCVFEDIDWLKKALKREYFQPVLGYSRRIQIWEQGTKKGSSKTTFTDPKKAFEKFEKIMAEAGTTWDKVTVVWSDPLNQPSLHVNVGEESDRLALAEGN